MFSTRFAGLDGVSLETAKVAEALERQGHQVVWFAGQLGPEFEPGECAPDAFFGTEENLALEASAFGGGSPEFVAARISDRATRLAGELDRFIDAFTPDVIVVQNAWAIPMQLPLAVALWGVVRARSLPAIGHHHDFAWERERFAHCVVPDVLEEVFPPVGDLVSHIVINQDARDELALRKGVDATVLPNVMDFATGPPLSDGGASFRELCQVGEGTRILLQPTRIIPRKGIELTIELAERLGSDVAVVVTHPDDKDDQYWGELESLAEEQGVDLRLVDAGRDAASLSSAYAAADLVCFPSLYEGYGNALVETMFHRRPLFVNRYSVYERDIAPLGIAAIEIDGSITDEAVARARRWIDDPSTAEDAIRRNTRIGLEHLSYQSVVDAFDRALSQIGQ